LSRSFKRGTFVYAGDILCDIRIVHGHTRHGSGDRQDPPEIASDRAADSFEVEYGSTTQRVVFIARSGAFDTLDEAMRHAAHSVADVRWQDDELTID